jgi:hypothetical protein
MVLDPLPVKYWEDRLLDYVGFPISPPKEAMELIYSSNPFVREGFW